MKDKQDIISSHKSNSEYPCYYHENDIEDMMDEHARQSIIDFLLWERQMQRDGFGPVILGRQPVDKVEIYFKEKATKP